MQGVEQHLTDIKGIGPVLAATILAEIGDISRFRSLKSLVAYTGIDPSVFQSGGFTGTQGHMSKRGSPYLRRALWLAAHTARLYNTDLNQGIVIEPRTSRQSQRAPVFNQSAYPPGQLRTFIPSFPRAKPMMWSWEPCVANSWLVSMSFSRRAGPMSYVSEYPA